MGEGLKRAFRAVRANNAAIAEAKRLTREAAAQTPGAIVLTLELPPNLANARMHWRRKDEARKAYRVNCDMRAAARLVPPAPAKPMDPVRLNATLYLWATMDDDNALARIKWAADWLKTRGYIVDDKRPHCRFTIPEQVIDRANQRLVLTISPL